MLRLYNAALGSIESAQIEITGRIDTNRFFKYVCRKENIRKYLYSDLLKIEKVRSWFTIGYRWLLYFKGFLDGIVTPLESLTVVMVNSDIRTHSREFCLYLFSSGITESPTDSIHSTTD